MTDADDPVAGASDLRLLGPAVIAWVVAAATLGSGAPVRCGVVGAGALLAGGAATLARGRLTGRGPSWRWPVLLCVVLVALLQGAALTQGALRERGGVRDLADARAVVDTEVLLTSDPRRVASRDGEERVLRDGTVRVLTGRGRTVAVSAPVL